MNPVPQDVIDHCARHPGCKGCPLQTCTAPLSDAVTAAMDAWITERVAAVRALGEAA